MQTDNDMVTIAQNRDEAEYQEAEPKLGFWKLIVDIFQRTEIYRLHWLKASAKKVRHLSVISEKVT